MRGIHPDDDVETFVGIVEARDRGARHGLCHQRADIADGDAVACEPGTIGGDDDFGLAADAGRFHIGCAANAFDDSDDLCCLFFKDLKLVAADFCDDLAPEPG